jgi:hypothetical protein
VKKFAKTYTLFDFPPRKLASSCSCCDKTTGTVGSFTAFTCDEFGLSKKSNEDSWNDAKKKKRKTYSDGV